MDNVFNKEEKNEFKGKLKNKLFETLEKGI